MDLDFSEEQEMLRNTARGICDQYVSSAVVREMENNANGFQQEFWRQLGELGISALGVPEAYGGMNWGSLEMTIVYEEFGRSLAPGPHFPSCVLGAKLIEIAATNPQQAEYLPQIATGESIVVPAWLEPGNGFGPEGVQMRVIKGADGYIVSGTKVMVPFADAATRLLVLARNGNHPEDIVGIFIDPSSNGVELSQQKNHSGETLYAVTFHNVPVPAGDVLVEEGFWRAWEEAMSVSVIALAAQAIGGAQAIHAMTVEYAKQRVQFGKPIGAFQAIAHYLADMAVEIEGARVLVYQASWARDNGKPFHKLAAMAKLQACNVFRRAAATGVQVHGGFGFTTEGDPQLFFRRSKYQQLTYWDSAYLEKRIAAAILDDEAA